MQNTSDNFEQWIQRHRVELDVWDEPAQLWEKIAKDVQKDDKSSLEQFIWQNRPELDSWNTPENLWEKISQKLEDTQETAFEQWVKSNRNDLERWEAPQDAWQKIEKKIAQKQERVFVIKHRTLWKVAAVIALLVTFVSTGYWIFQGNMQENNIAYNTQKTDLQAISPEIAEAEQYYKTLIAEKQQAIKTFDVSDAELQATLENSMQHLDSMYQQLKIELVSQDMAHQERIIEAMMNNLKMRIDILNRQLILLERVQKYQNKEKNNEEKHISL